MLRIGNLGVNVGFKWPSSAGLKLQDLAHLALWVQVQDKSRLRHGKTSKSVCLFCAVVQSPPSHTICPPNRTPTPIITTVKPSSLQPSLFRVAKWPTTLWHHFPPWHYPLELVWCHSLLLGPPSRAPRAALPAPVLTQAPTSPTGPHPPSGHLGVGPFTLAPLKTLGPA